MADTDPVTVRAVESADWPTLETLLPTLLPGSWSATVFAGTPYRQRVLVEGGEPVAFAEYDVVLDECHLFGIAVAPQRQRQGRGRRLLEAVLAEAREAGCTVCLLEVRRSNAAARALYLRMGFAETGCRRQYYPARHDAPAEDAVLYSLSFDSVSSVAR